MARTGSSDRVSDARRQSEDVRSLRCARGGRADMAVGKGMCGDLSRSNLLAASAVALRPMPCCRRQRDATQAVSGASVGPVARDVGAPLAPGVESVGIRPRADGFATVAAGRASGADL